MLTEGPLNISLMETDTGTRELHIDFSSDFKTLNIPERVEEIKKVINHLRAEINLLEESDPNRQGMLMILQITEEMLPHIETDNISLEETIVGEIQNSNPFGDLLSQASSTLKN
jgi:hypothetical protein